MSKLTDSITDAAVESYRNGYWAAVRAARADARAAVVAEIVEDLRRVAEVAEGTSTMAEFADWFDAKYTPRFGQEGQE